MNSINLENKSYESCWDKLKKNFKKIITEHHIFSKIYHEISCAENNILLYCIHGFPLDLFLDEVLKKKLNIDAIYKQKSQWKSLSYIENQYFFEIDMMNPDIRKDLNSLTDFILHIIQTHNISNLKKIIIIKHIEYLSDVFFEFRILLEKYSANVSFICTSHSISKIEAPIKSRFNIFRISLFTYEDVNTIFTDYLDSHSPIKMSRDLVKCIFLNDSQLSSESFEFRFPPLYDFVVSFDIKKDNLDNIRNISYKCCQYNISITDLVLDLLKMLDYEHLIDKIAGRKSPKKKIDDVKTKIKFYIIGKGSYFEHLLCMTNKGREPIYIETFLVDIFLAKDL